MSKRNDYMRLFEPTRSALSLAFALLCACGGEEQASNTPTRGASAGNELQASLAIYDGVNAPKTNVLLISLDSTRRDFLSCYGYKPQFAPEEQTTPHIDRLAAEGVMMNEAYSTTSWTLPAHMSLVTGQPELVHGVDLDPFSLNEKMPTLAAILRRVGYYTAGYYSGPYLHPRFGFGRGFDAYASAYGPQLEQANTERARLQLELENAQAAGDPRKQSEIRANLQRLDAALDALSHRDRSSSSVTDAAMAAVDRGMVAGRPWFVFAHYFDPHFDYDPPKELAQRFDPDYAGDISGINYFRNERIGKLKEDEPDYGPREQVCSERDLDHIKALYAAEIRWTDSEVGRLIEHLRKQRQYENTLIVLVADHGDEFFEHGGIGHRHSLYEELVRIPMVLRLPSSLPQGRAVPGLVSLTDVLPTVLEVLDLPLPANLASQSFLPLIDGRDDGAERYVLGRLVQYHPYSRIPGGLPIARVTVRESFRKGGLKLTRWRRWEDALPQAPPELKMQVEQKSALMRAKDLVLVWTDLGAGSEEKTDQFMSDFDSPRAKEALEEWRSIYAQVQRIASPSEVSATTGAATAQLQALGYVEAHASSRAPFDLPPPGEGR